MSCHFRFAVSPQGTCTKNVHYPCVLLVCHRFKMVGKSDLQTIMGQVLVPYFPLASQCMIPKQVHAECVKCTTVVLEEHLARTTRKSHAWSNIQFSYGWWATLKLIAQATCSISTTHFQTPWKHYVLYRRATANKFAEPVHAKSRTAGCKASFTCLLYMYKICTLSCRFIPFTIVPCHNTFNLYIYDIHVHSSKMFCFVTSYVLNIVIEWGSQRIIVYVFFVMDSMRHDHIFVSLVTLSNK